MEDDRVTVVARMVCGFEGACRHPACGCQHPPASARRILAALDRHDAYRQASAMAKRLIEAHSSSPDAALAAAATRWAKSETDPDRLAVARALMARFGG